ncbi:T9SS type A sorting domain-containing protein [Hymenobacter sp. BT635]|uniref:T9SS type A sorting domain-containing protein n=1 Tax=Hymenobacter nitidus TaxID=2880929 RepID=A0ABS8AHI2_9BACT|nr:T9SS type A sorting domain-containing protein [Hymenobacter nitidus]MCB2379122.1 T9SS type A sorting domain-containing protein [Hymenobacter nitidus]
MQHAYYRPLFLGALLVTSALTAQAQRFELDSSFDADGRVTTALTPPTSNDNVTKLYPQADGKIIALGRSRLGGWVTVRYDANGSIDTSYGTNGAISYDLATQRPNTAFTLAQLQLLPDGKLLAVGAPNGAPADSETAVGGILRFNANGTIDASFGDNGLVTRPTVAATQERGSVFRTAQVQADGKIVVVGSRYVRVSASGTQNYLLVARYNADGTPDMEYSTNFILPTVTFPSENDTDGYSLALLPNGTILAGGRFGQSSQSAFRAVFVRLLPDGTPDASFGTAGRRLYTELNYYANNRQILLLPDGKFLTNLGLGASFTYNASFARFLPSGDLDTTFGVNGVANFQHDSTQPTLYDGPYDVAGGYNNGELALQADGKIVVNGGNGTNFGLLRLNPDGTKDSSFGSNFDQTIRTEFTDSAYPGYYQTSGTSSVVVLPDGKIVAGGGYYRKKGPLPTSPPVEENWLFALARYSAVPTSTLPNGVWNGSVSTAYDNAQNWSNSVLPADTATNVLIPKASTRYPVLSTTAISRNLTVEEGATFTLAATGTLTAMGSLTLNGMVLGNGTLRTRGSQVQNITSSGSREYALISTLDVGPAGARLAGPLNVTQLLRLNGPLTTNGQILRLVSTNSTSAMVVNNTPTGVVTGAVTVERNINPALNLGKGYRHYSSPVSNAAFSTLAYNGFVPVRNQAYNTAADPGSVTPFPNIFEYNEARLSAANPGFDQGWQVPADALEPGNGYTVNTSSFSLGGSPISFVGTLNNGTITRTLTAGTQAGSGWNLVGNPYPAPLDWNLVSLPAGLDAAAYVFRSSGEYSGSYVSYVNGVGAGNILPAMQAFFVRATAPSVTLQFTNAARLTTYANPDFYRAAAETRPLLRLDLTAPGQAQPSDAAYVYFQQGATAQADSQFDAYKLPGSNGAQLSTVAGQTELSINGLPLLSSQGTSVALHAWLDQAGTYTLTAGQLLNFNSATPVLLEDKLTGTWHDLRQQPAYSFTVATANAALTSRFVLHFGQSRTLASQPSLGAATVNLFPNPVTGGQLRIQLSGLTGPSQQVAAHLYNPLGQVVRHQTLTIRAGSLDGVLSVQGLSKGVYTLRLTSGQQVSAHQIIIAE